MSVINQSSAIAIEQLANRILLLDAEAQHKLTVFTNKVIHIHIEDLALDYFLTFPNACLVVQPSCSRKISASISGKMSAFLAAMTDENSTDGIFKGELQFTGEINTARQLQTFVQSLQIDWQEPFSQLFGDQVGHNVASLFGKAANFGKQFIGNLAMDIPEYLQEEIKVAPTSVELMEFYDHVDLLRSQADRLAARVARITQND